MTGTYTAVEVSEPGKLQVVQRPPLNPADGYARMMQGKARFAWFSPTVRNSHVDHFERESDS